MNPVAVITARGGSKGVPRKNLINFCGLPLIAWSIKQAMDANLRTYVSTEDDDIKRCALEFGAALIDRPSELAQDDTPTVRVLQHVQDELNLQKIDFDSIVLLQPTSPLRMTHDIRDALTIYDGTDTKYLFCCTRFSKILWDEDCPPFPAGMTPRRQDLPKRFKEHGMLYIYDVNYQPLGFGEIENNLIYKFETKEWQSHEIDEVEDVDICEYYMRRKILCSHLA